MQSLKFIVIGTLLDAIFFQSCNDTAKDIDRKSSDSDELSVIIDDPNIIDNLEIVYFNQGGFNRIRVIQLINGVHEGTAEQYFYGESAKYDIVVKCVDESKGEQSLQLIINDEQVSNVLFDDEDKGLCVIDLDTVMQGYFISDIGDMMRTYLSPVNEEIKDFSKIEIRENYFKSIWDGYMSEMKDELNPEERRHFIYSGKFMIYMQAIRFLTDHLNNDTYYGAKYEGQNFVRAGNQVTLLQRLMEKEELLKSLIKKK